MHSSKLLKIIIFAMMVFMLTVTSPFFSADNTLAAESKSKAKTEEKSEATSSSKTDTTEQKSYAIDGSRELKLKDSKGASVIEAKSNVFLYDKRGDKKFYPASTTKIMTAILVLENVKDLNKETTISANAVDGIDPSSSHIALEIGEKVRIIDLLYGLMLASGNDCAVALAEEVAGSVKDFAKLMNEKAKELGAVNSHFVNPHGLFSKHHYSTPKDMARIMNYCVKNKTFVKIISSIKYVIPKTKKSKKRELWNTHRMMKLKDQYYKGVIGGKTGFIHESGCNLITYAKRGNMELIAVGSGAPFPSDQCKMTKRMFDRYFKNFTIGSIAKEDLDIQPLELEDKKVESKPKHDIRLVLPKNADQTKVTQDCVFDDVKLPIEKDQKIGRVNCIYNDRVVGTASLYADSYYPTQFESMVILISIIAGGVLILVIIITIMMKRKKKNASENVSEASSAKS